jgi:AcrR family transcriptional regulator
MARTGRPAGGTRNREAILAAAAHQFSELGYDRTSMRAVAAEAGVDQALIAHYFGSKHQLFMDAVEFPLDPAEILPEILAGSRRSIGERLARAQLAVLEDPDARRRLTGLVRAASSERHAAQMLREFLTNEVIGPVAEALGSDEAELRVGLVGSQIIGLVMSRYIVEVEPLASLPADRVVELIAPTLQRYLTQPLPRSDGKAGTIAGSRRP